MRINKFFFLLIILIFPIPNAFALVTVNGTVFTMDDSTLSVVSPITVGEIQVEGDGISTRNTDADDLRKYSFYNTTGNPTLNLNFDSIASLSTQFTRTTAGILGLNVNASGSELTQTNIDGDTSGTWDFASSLNHVLVNAGVVIQLIWSVIVPPVTGGGGGGGGFFTIDIEIIAEEQQLGLFALGTLQDGELIVNWDTQNDLVIRDLTITESELGSLSLVFNDPPFVLEGDSDGLSSQLIPYTYSIPPEVCTTTIFANCIEPILYEIPVEFQIEHLGNTIRQDTVIPINLSGEVFQLDLPSLLLLIGVAAVAFLVLIAEKRKKGKATHRAQPKKPKSRIIPVIFVFIAFMGFLSYIAYLGVLDEMIVMANKLGFLGLMGVIGLLAFITLFVVIIYGKVSTRRGHASHAKHSHSGINKNARNQVLKHKPTSRRKR